MLLAAQILATEIILAGTQKPRLFWPVLPDRSKRLCRRAANMSEPVTITDFTVAPGVRETASEDGAVLLDIEQGMCFSLNPVGLRIWELLKRQRSLDQIADALGHEFSVPRSQILSDATEFIAALEAKQLIRRPSHASPQRPWLSRIFHPGKGRFSAQ
jgi:Coenzyme PQQ synthesis protein D (PqqD)